MRILFISTFLVALSIPTKAQINFRKDPWAAVLKDAKARQKPIFIDIYTTWCKPCKEMERTVFSHPVVGEALNADFICLQIDGEKGDGPALVSNYQVSAYPTTLFLDSRGNKVHNTEGLLGVTDFLTQTEHAKALLADERSIETYEDDYKKGNRNPEFLLSYMKKRKLLKQDNGQILEEYLVKLPFAELKNEQTIALVYEHATLLRGRGFEVLMSKRTDNKVQQKLHKMWILAFNQAVKLKNENLLNEVIVATQRIAKTPAEAKELSAEMQLNYWLALRQKERIPTAAVVYLDTYVMPQNIEILKRQEATRDRESPSKFLNYVNNLGKTANYIQENFEEKLLLEKALAWAKRSTDLVENSSNTDTYAHLLYKLGQKKEALIAQEKAIALAKKSNEDKAFVLYLEEELAKMK
jgi:thioredoxin-related protein